MNIEYYEVGRSSDFEKEVKRFLRKKRFFSLPAQIKELENKLRKGEFDGELIRRGENPAFEVYKLRLPNPDTNAGKSDGYRVYYIIATEHKVIILMCIYYKKEFADMPDTYIDGLIDGCLLEILPDDDAKEM